jgi:hypothetical protein
MGARCYHVRFLELLEPVSLSSSRASDICYRCEQAGYLTPTADDEGNELAALLGQRFERLLDTGRALFETNVTEEDKIVPTLAFAAAIADQQNLVSVQERFAKVRQGSKDRKELSEGFAQIVNVMRPVDVGQGGLVLQLEPAFVRPVTHPETEAIERIEIEIYWGSAKDVAERYRHIITQQKIPLTDIPGRLCLEPQPGYLAVTLNPEVMLPGRPSFPPSQLVERFCEGLLGSRSKGGFAPNLWGRERGYKPEAYNIISECAAYYLGNYGEAAEKIKAKRTEETKQRKEVINTLRRRAIDTLNNRLLVPSGQEPLSKDRSRTIWEDVRKREQFLYLLKTRLETRQPRLERLFLEKDS